MSTPRSERTRRRTSANDRRLAPYLLACDETAAAELEAMIATLPLCARGRVFIEVPTPDDVGIVTVPSRMTVTWLPRSARSGAPGTGESCARGAALARATTAWADEMLCAVAIDSDVDAASGPAPAEVWLGGDYRGVAPIVEHLVDRLGVDASRISAPARYRLV